MPAERKTDRVDVDAWLIACILVAALSATGFAWASLARHSTYHSNAYDLGIKHQVTWNTHRGDWFEYTYMVDVAPQIQNHLGDHVNLILVPISWLYHLHDGPETLLILQAVLVASGAIPIFLLARGLEIDPLPALFLAFAYLLHPVLQAAVLFDFHAIVLATPLLLWTFLFLEERRNGWLVVTTVLLLLLQENVALTVAMLGLYSLLCGRPRLGGGLVAAGAIWFLACFFVVLPAFNSGQAPNAFARYAHLGETWSDAAVHLMTHPMVVVDGFLDPAARRYLRSILAPLGYVSLLSPAIWLVASSELLLNLLSSFEFQRLDSTHYSSVLLAVAAVAAVRGVAWLGRVAGRWRPTARTMMVRGGASWVLVASLAFQFLAYGNLRSLAPPYRDLYWRTDHTAIGAAFLSRIPPDPEIAVSASGTVAPHLSSRRRVYVFPSVHDAEYVVLDRKSSLFPVELFPIAGLTPEAAFDEYVRRLGDQGFERLDARDGWMLFRRTKRDARDHSSA